MCIISLQEVVVAVKNIKKKHAKDNAKSTDRNDAIKKYLLNLSIALIAALFSFFLQKVFGIPL